MRDNAQRPQAYRNRPMTAPVFHRLAAAPRPVAPFSHAVESDGWVLVELGLGLEHALQMRVYLTDFERDYAAMNAVYASFFPPDRLPARTCVGVTGLARGALVEIDLVARRPETCR